MLVLARADAGALSAAAGRSVSRRSRRRVPARAVDVLAAERGVTIRAADSPEIPFHGDEDLLRQLVLNVLQNAVQHAPAGGSVDIDCAPRRSAPSPSASATPAGDPGGRSVSRIFDRFVQLDPSAPRPGHRSGPADRALDCRSTPRHASCSSAQRPGRHHVLRVAADRSRLPAEPACNLASHVRPARLRQPRTRPSHDQTHC